MVEACLPSQSPLASLVPTGLLTNHDANSNGGSEMDTAGTTTSDTAMTTEKTIDNLRLKICLQERPDDLAEWVSNNDPWTEEVSDFHDVYNRLCGS